MATVLVSMLGLVISAALFSEAALRDHETRMFSLFATSPLTKTQYLAGRFVGTLLVNVLFVSIVPIMLMLVMRPPFVKEELLGPFSAASYVQPAIVLLLPNVLFTGAILFAVGVLTGGRCGFRHRRIRVSQRAAGSRSTSKAHASCAPCDLIDPCGFSPSVRVGVLEDTREETRDRLDGRRTPLEPRVVDRRDRRILLFTRWRFRTNVALERRKGRREDARGVSRARVSPAPRRDLSRPRSTGELGSGSSLQSLVSRRGALFSRDFAVTPSSGDHGPGVGTETSATDFRSRFCR